MIEHIQKADKNQYKIKKYSKFIQKIIKLNIKLYKYLFLRKIIVTFKIISK